MIAITKVATIDASTYSHVRCPECKSKIGWKPKGSKVNLYQLSERTGGKMETIAVTCLRCKSNYLISTEKE